MGELASINMHHVIRQSADEIDIVADEDQRAGELVESKSEGIDARHVQVRGRFVHQEEIRRVKKQFDERQAALFTATEHAHLFENVVAAEKETAQQRADELFGDALGCGKGLLEYRVRRVEHVHPLLGIVTC